MPTEPLRALRSVMAEQNIQAVIIPTSDFHDTEYVSDYYKARMHFSGFTGSAGTLVVLEDGGALWTDGRYFIQAARELEGTGITLMKIGQPNTPSISQYIISHLKPGDRVAVDGRTISKQAYDEYQSELAAHDLQLIVDQDLPGLAWPDRPALPASKTFTWPDEYAGESVTSKLAGVRQAMKEAGVTRHITTKIDEVAWLLNLRAHDIPSFPAPLAYVSLGLEDGILYIDGSRLDAQSAQVLKDNSIEVRDYNAIYDDVPALQEAVLVDPRYVNSRIAASLENPVWQTNPIFLMKAIKNPTEQEGARQAHLKDGAAIVRFWKWLEEALQAGQVITEEDAADKAHAFRQQQKDFLEDSFAAISAYGPNAAMPHYKSSREKEVVIEPRGLYLLDSGGQYLDGTTDITRTFVVGDLTDEEREGFTRVLQGHINLARAVYPEGTRGYNLDILTRAPIWNMRKDFNHGTGHGVGALSSVHEGPNSYYWKVTPTRRGDTVFVPGMITSDEPGLYVEGSYGIRHENLLLTRQDEANDFGRFLSHEVLTMVPFDIQGLDLHRMAPDEIDWLNAYHQEVLEKLTPLLNEEEILWLKEKTKPVEKTAL